MKEKKKRYDWSPNDDILVYYLYRCDYDCEFCNDKFVPIESIMKYQRKRFRLEQGYRECTLEERRKSIIARYQSFRRLATKGEAARKCLPSYAQQTEDVYYAWKDKSQAEHRKKCKAILKQAGLYNL